MTSDRPAVPRSLLSRLISVLYRNWISLAGLFLSVSAAFAFIFLFAIDLFAHHGNPYMGILAYIVAPGFFMMGVALIIVGRWIDRRQLAKAANGPVRRSIHIDLSLPQHRRHLFFFLAGATVFLLLTALGSYRSYHVTESVGFCGQVCHTVMEPEFVTYQHSPHARVSCAECHVGSGARWYLKSKLSGLHQVYSVVTDSYPRPVPSPVVDLRPAQETCEQCHWPEKFSGDRVKTYVHTLSDDENSSYSIRLALKVGGGNPTNGPVGGIHWHMSIANKVEYIATDDKRQDIPWVRFTDHEGKVRIYTTDQYRETPPPGEIRLMDCVDCHNRPAHNYQSPNDIVEQALALGRVDRTLPKFKYHAVAALTAEYDTVEAANAGIDGAMRRAYPDRPSVQGAIEELQRSYRANFFPLMKARWDAYPENIGHKDWPGCFRCHDDAHSTADGELMISSTNCNACHDIIAQGSDAEMENFVGGAGMPFQHPSGDVEGLACNMCHNGANQEE